MLSLCSDVRQVGILKYLRSEDADDHRHRPVNCPAGMGANFRWTTTVVERVTRYVAIHRELKSERPGPRRSALVDEAFALKKTAIPIH